MNIKRTEIFLDDLPRWKSGRYKGKINWNECIGYKVKCIYNKKDFEIKIINYIIKKGERYLVIKYKNKELEIQTGNFVRCCLGGILNETKRTKEFKIEVGQTFKDNKRDLIVTSREYREDQK